MSSAKKLLEAAAGNAGGAGLDVAEVFSTYLYTGNASTQTVTNGIDLSGEGGLVWFKNRSASSTNHSIFDTESGATGGKRLRTNLADGLQTFSGSAVFTTSSTGFALNNVASNDLNDSLYDYASWTFRKAPKFFDVVTYTGTGSTQNISHNLGAVPAVMIVKSLVSGSRWNVYHKDASPTGNPQNGRMALNTTDAWNEAPGVSVFAGLWNQTAPTDSVFTVGSYNDTNASGENFVAYLFAHNNGDGEFGPGGDQDIIKCGGYTGNGSTTGPVINLGWEPQWILVKKSSDSDNWHIFDSMRGISTGSNDIRLIPNTSAAEVSTIYASLTATGFNIDTAAGNLNQNGETFIYMAIRAPMITEPEAATDVFAIQAQAGGYPVNRFASSGFPVDLVLDKKYDSTGNWLAYDRMRGGNNDLVPNLTNAEAANSPAPIGFDFNTGITEAYFNSSANVVLPMWKRAKGYMDVVAYTGTGSDTTQAHSLGVAPEMMWVKCRSSAESWAVYHAGITNPAQNYLYLDESSALNPNANTIKYWNNTNPTDSVFTVGIEDRVNGSAKTYIAYLFATLAGISKVGSYTGTTLDINVDCGFSNGARFIMIKRTDSTGNWHLFDTARGISASNDPYLYLNTTAAQVTNTNFITPLSSGFTVTYEGGAQLNDNNGEYIFYAIA